MTLIRPAQLLLAFTLPVASLSALAQTKAERQFSYLDLGVQAVGQFTKTVSGPVVLPAYDQGQLVSESASNTVGALVTIRYSPRPYLGAELNASFVRYSENFNVAPVTIQTSADEYTVGYLVTPPYTIFGVKPYASAGGGIIRFGPTAGGGQEAPAEGVPAVYYNLGIQHDLLAHLGVRLGFRQVFFTAPDFYQNYLTIDKRTVTSEPMIGFYLHY